MRRPELPEDYRKAHAGERVYIKKAWSKTKERDRLIRRTHRENVKAGLAKVESMRRLAVIFDLSLSRLKDIIYS